MKVTWTREVAVETEVVRSVMYFRGGVDSTWEIGLGGGLEVGERKRRIDDDSQIWSGSLGDEGTFNRDENDSRRSKTC